MRLDPKSLGNRLVTFAGGNSGAWKVTSMKAVSGAGLKGVDRVSVCRGGELLPGDAAWVLAGVASHVRYVEAPEQAELAARQPMLGRPEATQAALIPIRKSSAWWELSQEKRRRIFEAQSHHIAEGMKVLPGVARQLYHSRDLGEPFDFLTWFEYAPAHAQVFEDLVRHLRQTDEWAYVEREIDIRLTRIGGV